MAKSTPRCSKCRRLRTEVVIRRIPQHPHTVRLGQRRVVKLDLHVDDVGNSRPHQFDHVPVVPDAPTNRDSVGDPGHVHARLRSPVAACASLLLILQTLGEPSLNSAHNFASHAGNHWGRSPWPAPQTGNSFPLPTPDRRPKTRQPSARLGLNSGTLHATAFPY